MRPLKFPNKSSFSADVHLKPGKKHGKVVGKANVATTFAARVALSKALQAWSFAPQTSAIKNFSGKKEASDAENPVKSAPQGANQGGIMKFTITNCFLRRCSRSNFICGFFFKLFLLSVNYSTQVDQ